MAVVKKTVAPVAAKVEAPKAEVKKAAPTTPVKTETKTAVKEAEKAPVAKAEEKAPVKAEVKKPAAKKETVKKETKKAAPAKAEAKKPVAKKTELKSEISVQFGGKSYSQEELLKIAKDVWKYDLKQAIALNVEHISAYHLIYEEGTPMYNMLQQHRISEVDEESSVGFFSELIDQLTTAGYEHYEISNFSRPGYHSQHNTAYWKNIPYLGCGPSAHSFNRQEREWNIASLNDYINGIENGKRIYETEDLNTVTRYNEFIITSLRTCWGIPLAKLKEEFGTELWQYCLDSAALSLKNGKLIEKDNALRLTREGIFISDSIMSDLLKIEE